MAYYTPISAITFNTMGKSGFQGAQRQAQEIKKSISHR